MMGQMETLMHPELVLNRYRRNESLLIRLIDELDEKELNDLALETAKNDLADISVDIGDLYLTALNNNLN